MKNLVSLSAAAAILATSVAIVPSAAEARPGYRGGYGYGQPYAYRGRRGGRGGVVAGAAVAGIAGALIGGAIAQSQSRQYYQQPYGYYDAPQPAYGYGYGRPAYGYGYAPSYYAY